MADKAKAEKRFDAYQEAAVTCLRNAVVSAGAGTGKTSVLADRYIRLIRQGAGVENILTLTFTRKSASEMYERIYKRLSEDKDDPVVKAELAKFDKAQISTLDSFCSHIVKNSCKDFGIPSDFAVDNEAVRRLAEEEALAFVLEKQDDPALREFLHRNGFVETWKSFFASLAHTHFSLAEPIDFDRTFEIQNRLLRDALDRAAGTLSESFQRICSLPDIDITCIRTNKEVAASLIGLLSERTDIESLKRGLENLKFNKQWGGSKKPEVQELKSLLEAAEAARDTIVETAGTLLEADSMRHIFALCSEFQERFLVSKRAAGTLSFHDVMSMAVKILLSNTSLRRYYKERFRYVMIDEFQDNNRTQKDLLYLIAERMDKERSFVPDASELENDKLFFVGDEKQSIYRFRGADVSVFRHLKEEIEMNGGVSLELRTNYRSMPGLIDFFNAVFPRIMADAQNDYEARYDGLTAGSGSRNFEPFIKVFYKPYDKDKHDDTLDADMAEAYHIARFIHESVKKGTLSVCDETGTRSADYGDFAVLLRSTGNLVKYERMFRLFGIPYTTENVRSLFLEALLNDMYNLLQVLVYPEDKTSYAGLLRSPLVNVSDSTLVRLLLAGGLPFEGTVSTEEDREKFEAGRIMYEYLKTKVDQVPIGELIFDIFYTFGYRYFLLKNPSYHGYLEYYDYFQKLAGNADAKGMCLADFLDEIRPFLGSYEKLDELEILKEEAKGVEIMSIHKSKGLEFPIVICANSGNMGRTRGLGDSLYYFSPEYGLTINTTERKNPAGGKKRYNYFYRLSKEEDGKKELAETKRLLYVALTRAKNHLVVSGVHNNRNRTAEGVLLNMVLRALSSEFRENPENDPALTPFIEKIPDIPVEYGRRPVGGRYSPDIGGFEQLYAALPVIERNMPRIEYSATELNAVYQSGGEPEGCYEALPSLECDAFLESEELAEAFGTLCHALIEQRILTGSYAPGSLSRAVTSRFPEQFLHQCISSAISLSDKFFESNLWTQVKDAKRKKTELAFLYRHELAGTRSPYGYRLISGKMDLFCETETAAYVIDFKTDKVYKPHEYDAQMKIYTCAAQELTDKDIEAYVFYLRSCRAVKCDEGISLDRIFDGTA